MPNIVAWSAAKRGRRLISTALTLWLGLAVVAGMTGGLRSFDPPVIMAGIAAVTLACLFIAWRVPSVNAWAKHTSLRALVGLHLTRLVGIAFLVLHARGELGDFALAAGWGDIAVAVTALALVLVVLPITSWVGWGLVFLWNLAGLIDLVLVLQNAARLGLDDPAQIAPMFVFPMSLLPTFLVPLLLATHGLIFWRLWRTSRRLRKSASRPSTPAPSPDPAA